MTFRRMLYARDETLLTNSCELPGMLPSIPNALSTSSSSASSPPLDSAAEDAEAATVPLRHHLREDPATGAGGESKEHRAVRRWLAGKGGRGRKRVSGDDQSVPPPPRVVRR